MITINSQIFIEKTEVSATQEEIKNEPMLFNCSYDFAMENGGRLTKEFLSRLDFSFATNKDLSIVIDSRSHMLMPTWYPCIPGWHHDDVPRENNGQPDYYYPSYRSHHCLMILGGGSKTDFAVGKTDFPEVPEGEKYYKFWHPVVERNIRLGKLKRIQAEFGDMIYFTDRTWHTGTPAYESAWRFFIRASLTKRVATNEIRKQVQVYLENPIEGW